MTACIYLITNQITKKQYVGFTTQTLDKRCSAHLSDVKNGSKIYFHNSIRKYGWYNFTSEIIYMSTDADHCLNTMESYFIKQKNTKRPNGFNLTDGGGGPLGLKRTEENKMNNRLARLGIPHSEDRKLNIGKANKGKKRTEEQKQKMKDISTGKKHTEESLDKMRGENNHFYGKKHSQESIELMSKKKRKYQHPPKYQLADMISLFTNKKISEYYGCSSETIRTWRCKLELVSKMKKV